MQNLYEVNARKKIRCISKMAAMVSWSRFHPLEELTILRDFPKNRLFVTADQYTEMKASGGQNSKVKWKKKLQATSDDREKAVQQSLHWPIGTTGFRPEFSLVRCLAAR